jgi:hypothetical protein
MSDLSKEELYTHMEMAMASYVSLYTRVMLRELGIDESYESDVQDRKKMALQLVEPLNHASYAALCGYEGQRRRRPSHGRAQAGD